MYGDGGDALMQVLSRVRQSSGVAADPAAVEHHATCRVKRASMPSE
jgi:hypothetical protein